jgi:hypothetical protein
MPPVRALGVVTLLALAACSHNNAATRNPSPSASAPATARPSATPSGGGTASPRASGGTATETPAPLPPPPGRATESTPPAPGTYTYSQTGTASFGGQTTHAEPSGTLSVARATLAPNGQRQRQSRRYSASRTRDQDLLFTARGIYLERAVEHVGAGSFSQSVACAPAKPLLAIELPLKVGATWSDEGECDGEKIRIDAKIVRSESRSVGGTTVATFVVRSTVALIGSQYSATTKSDTWISPKYRLVVHATEQTDGTYGGAPFARELTETLRKLNPS